MPPVLFYGTPQGCSFGSIMALEWLGQPYQLNRINMLEQPWDPRFGLINPHFQTPAMMLEDGSVLDQSMAILLHLAGRGMHLGLGHPHGSRDYDQLNQMLAYLNTDFFSAFSTLWAAYEMADIDEVGQSMLLDMGRDAVARQCRYLNNLLASRDYLLGPGRSLADAYLAGIARWVNYHQLFDTQQDYPALHRYIEMLRSDPAHEFAEAIEAGKPAIGCGAFQGHVSLDELVHRLAA